MDTTTTKTKKSRPRTEDLRERVKKLASEPEYQHPPGSPNPACVAGAPNASKIAPLVGVKRARVQQILRELRAAQVAAEAQSRAGGSASGA